MKDHEIAALVNDLRDIAVSHHSSGQLRERIAHIIVPLFKAPSAPPAPAGDDWITAKVARHLDMQFRNGVTAGWNAGLIEDTEALARLKNRVGTRAEYEAVFPALSAPVAPDTIRDLDRIGMQFAADLCKLPVAAASNKRNVDYLVRQDVMDLVVAWRGAWNKNSASRPHSPNDRGGVMDDLRADLRKAMREQNSLSKAAKIMRAAAAPQKKEG